MSDAPMLRGQDGTVLRVTPKRPEKKHAFAMLRGTPGPAPGDT